MKMPSAQLDSSSPAISIRGISKVYHLFERPIDRLKHQLFGHLKSYGKEFWALKDIDLEIGHGETIGIVGRNGSGKSTLLQIIAGVLQPTTGEIAVAGRVAAMLELGSGFNPEYTGKENVFMNGSILGMSKAEMERRYDEIIDFAEIGDFIDQPVKTYSSGMYVRLAFSVQACIRPDILIVDEALSVGDAKFQRKCFRRMEELKERGVTILFVTHDVNAVINHCSRAVLLEQGQMVAQGRPQEIVERYQKLLFGADTSGPIQEYGDGGATFVDIWTENDDGARIESLTSGDRMRFCVRVKFHKEIENPVLGMRLKSIQGVTLTAANTANVRLETGRFKAGDEVVMRWMMECNLEPNSYFFSCGVSYPDTDRFLCRRVDTHKISVTGVIHGAGLVNLIRDVEIVREGLGVRV